MSLLSFFRNVCFPKPVHIIINYYYISSLWQNVPWNHYFCTHCTCFALKLKALFLPTFHFPHPSLSLLVFPIICVFFLSTSLLSPVIVFISPYSLRLSSVGRLLIEFSSQMTMERVQKENPNVTEGGRYTPPDCRPRWKVCTLPSQFALQNK